jgi:hypothetical protein
VSLLLNHVVGWMRTQSGTTSLRAILYIDEVFGYLPPVANPPSKLPLLTLMKQARAFGVGVALVTQNPVDLDYKSLSNTGTWFIGRLQTDRDKIRVLDALEGVSAGTGKGFDRNTMDQLIAGLGNRVFLMHNVNDDAPTIFQTRWAMSYLRGPLTREQIKVLVDPIKSAAKAARPPTESGPGPRVEQTPPGALAAPQRPVLPTEIPQYFLRPSGRSQGPLVFRPMVLGVSQVRFSDAKRKVDVMKELNFLAALTDDPVPLNWDKAEPAGLTMSDLTSAPLEPAKYSDLPAAAAKPKSYDAWQKDFANWLARSQRVDLLRSPGLDQFSRADEKESDFRIRMQLAARELSDQNMEKLRKKYAPKYATLDERIRKARMAMEKEREQASRQKYQTAMSLGSSILGAVVGRRVSSSANRTVRDYGRAAKERKDVEYAGDNLEALQLQKKRLEDEFQQELKAMDEKMDPLTEKLETVSITPKKADISIKLVALVWSPSGQ